MILQLTTVVEGFTSNGYHYLPSYYIAELDTTLNPSSTFLQSDPDLGTPSGERLLSTKSGDPIGPPESGISFITIMPKITMKLTSYALTMTVYQPIRWTPKHNTSIAAPRIQNYGTSADFQATIRSNCIVEIFLFWSMLSIGPAEDRVVSWRSFLKMPQTQTMRMQTLDIGPGISIVNAEKIAGSASPVESDGAYYQYIADKNTAYRVFYFYYPDGVTSTTMHLKNTVDYAWISKYDGYFYGYFYYTIDLEMRYADEVSDICTVANSIPRTNAFYSDEQLRYNAIPPDFPANHVIWHVPVATPTSNWTLIREPQRKVGHVDLLHLVCISLEISKPLCLFAKGIRVKAFGLHPGREKIRQPNVFKSHSRVGCGKLGLEF
eukprot:sb/3465706/